MHARSALPVFGRLREAVEEGAPMSAGYARRFSVSSGPGQCLSRLDRPQGGRRDRHSPGHGSRVRPPADGAGRPGITGTFLPPSHALRRGVRRRRPGLPAHLSQAVGRGLSLYAAGHRPLRPSLRPPSEPPGQPRGGRAAGLKALQGIFLTADSHDAYAESNEYLTRQLAATVEAAAKQTQRFFQAAESGAPLDPWLDRDFKGTRLSEGAGGLPQSAPA